MRLFSSFIIATLIITILLAPALVIGNPQLLSRTPKPSGLSKLLETGFEDDVPMQIAINGSLPLGTPGRPIGFGQMDLDAKLTVNETYPEGLIWGRAGIWVVRDPTKAHSGNSSVKLWAGSWTENLSPKKALEYFDTETVYDLMMRKWPQNHSQLYVRWYQKFESLPPNPWDYITIFYLIGHLRTPTYWSTYMESLSVNIAKTHQGYSLGISKLWGAKEVSTLINITTNKWYSFEVWYKYGVTDGEYKFWMDGKTIFSLTGLNTTPPLVGETLPRGFDLGIRHRSNRINNITAWLDDVVVANYRVGPIDWTPPSVDLSIEVLDSSSKNNVSNALVQLGSYQQYTNETGFATFDKVQGFSNYVLNISKFGYRPFIDSIDIFDKDLNLKVHLDPIPAGKGSVEVHTYKENRSVSATVPITQGTMTNFYATPFITDLDKGTHKISIHYGDQIVNKTITVLEGRLVVYELEIPVGNATLEIRSFKDSAEVASIVEIVDINSTTRNVKTPSRLVLKPGVYGLKVIYGNQTLIKTETLGEGQKASAIFYFESETKRENSYIRDYGPMVVLVAMIVGTAVFIKKR